MSLLGALAGAAGGVGEQMIDVGTGTLEQRRKEAILKMQQEFQRSEREAGERFTAGENVKQRDHDSTMQSNLLASNERISNAEMANQVRLKIAELEAAKREGNLDRQQQLELLRLQNAHDAWKTQQNNNTTLTVAGGNNATSVQTAQIGADASRDVAGINNAGANARNAADNTTKLQVAGMQESGAWLRQQAGFDHAVNVLGIEIASKEKMQQAGFNHETALEDSRQRHARIIQQSQQNATSEENARQRAFDAVQNDLQRSNAIKAISEQTRGALALAATKANLELMKAQKMPITVEDLQIGADSSGQFFFYMDPISGQPVKLTGITAPDANKLNIRDIPTGEAGLLGEREKMPHVLVNGQWVPMQIQGQAAPSPLDSATSVQGDYDIMGILESTHGPRP